MGFFEDALFEVKKAGKKVGVKANEVYGITKKKAELGEVSSKIRTAYEEIGKILYQIKKGGEDSSSQIDTHIATIDELIMKEKEIQEEINRLKNIATCEKCGSDNSMESVFCAKCGEKLSKTSEQAAEDTMEKENEVVVERVVAIGGKVEEKIETVVESKPNSEE